MWNVKQDTNEHVHETDSQTQGTDLCCQGGQGWGWGWIGSLGLAGANYCM